ncbi:polyphosphate kinase [Yersinia frederiksenii]|uniref:polyphosphate kinase n=1 Tax=Yersinia frederiksenii TaxID=29484 RepID=UPI001D048E62|nr:polyphosphate kinase [Yersinia frederiksenii]
MLSKERLEKRIVEIRAIASEMKWSSVEHSQIALSDAEALEELLSLREQLAELKASIGFNVGDRVCDSVDKLGYGYVVSINNGRVAYPISVQFDKSDKGRISTYTADGRKLSGCPVCLYKTQSVTAAKPAEIPRHIYSMLVNELRDVPAIGCKRELIIGVLNRHGITAELVQFDPPATE